MEFQFLQRFQTGSDRFDIDLRDLEVLQDDSGSWLYAVNGVNGGISLFRLDGSAAPPELMQRYWHEGADLGTGAFALGEIGGEMRLLFEGSSSGDLLSYDIGGNGALSAQQTQSLASASAGGLETSVVGGLSAGAHAGDSLVYGITESGVLQGWRLDGSGTVQAQLATTGGDSAYQLPAAGAGSSGLEILAEAGLLFALDPLGQGLRSYRIDSESGALQAADQLGISEGLPVSDPTALQSLQAHGANWLVLASAGSGSLSVMRVAADGSLQLVDQLNDTLATRFGAVSLLELVVVEGHVLVLAAGADDGLSLLRLLPSGQLMHVTSLADAAGLGLQNVTALESALLGDQLEIYVSSGTSGGISRLALDLGDLGGQHSLLEGAGTLQGSAGDDLLQGGSGAVTLQGGWGDDTLVASGAGSRLTGGLGADLFALGAIADPGGGAITVLDFTPGEDRLDLSLFTGLYSPAQLQQHSHSGGLELRFGSTRIVVQSASGTDLTLEDLWPDGRFDSADRLALGDSAAEDITYGSGSADLLEGSGGADRIWGLGGDDELRGQGGADELMGGDGNDILRGGWGADTVCGELGDDMVLGGGGNDLLYGNEGNDDVQGHKGNDTLWGGPGNDSLKGNMGADHLYGGLGNDDIRGGTENDQLWGEEGADLLVGQAGSDSLMGGAANDTLKGGADPDWAWGYNGDDVLKGGRGRDNLFGGTGNDQLSGDMGGDWLTGGDGADSFVFGKVHGQDEILDFTPGEDLIDLSGMGVAGDDFSDLEISQLASGVLVATGNGQILLQGLLLADITADDFLF